MKIQKNKTTEAGKRKYELDIDDFVKRFNKNTPAKGRVLDYSSPESVALLSEIMENTPTVSGDNKTMNAVKANLKQRMTFLKENGYEFTESNPPTKKKKKKTKIDD